MVFTFSTYYTLTAHPIPGPFLFQTQPPPPPSHLPQRLGTTDHYRTSISFSHHRLCHHQLTSCCSGWFTQPAAGLHSKVRKYDGNRNRKASNLLPPTSFFSSSRTIGGDIKKLLIASISKSTWSKYSTANKSLAQFCDTHNKPNFWPLDKSTIREYVCYLLNERRVSPQTAKEYLSGLKTLHILKDNDVSAFNDPMTKYMLSGAKNLRLNIPEVSKRRAVSIPLLQLIIRKVSDSEFHEVTKSSLITLSSLAFFGALRMGELVSTNRHTFDPTTTLTPDDVCFNQASVTLHIKSPKVSVSRGDFVDLFAFTPDTQICPLTTFKNHKNLLVDLGRYRSGIPIFQCESGFFTTAWFNNKIKEVIGEDIDWERHTLSAHSFRAGLPSTLQKTDSSLTNIMRWGRWRSGAVNTYRRQALSENRATFQLFSEKINEHIN